MNWKWFWVPACLLIVGYFFYAFDEFFVFLWAVATPFAVSLAVRRKVVGPIATIKSIYRNCAGGKDLTEGVALYISWKDDSTRVWSTESRSAAT